MTIEYVFIHGNVLHQPVLCNKCNGMIDSTDDCWSAKIDEKDYFECINICRKCAPRKSEALPFLKTLALLKVL